MFKLEKSRDSQTLRVSGRIEAENLADLRMQIHPPLIALELGEVRLVDAEAVRFLATIEAAGTELRKCPLFIREWIRRENPELIAVTESVQSDDVEQDSRDASQFKKGEMKCQSSKLD